MKMKKVFESAKGELLLDSGSLDGSFFHQAAVYVCDHDEEGAVGFLVNYPAVLNMDDLVVGHVPEKFRHAQVLVGGPVMRTSMFCLVRSSVKRDSYRRVVPGVYLVSSLDDFFDDEDQLKPENVLFFMGYAGWSALQLDGELKEGCWLKVKTSAREIFEKGPKEDLWKYHMKKQGGLYPLMAQAPRNIFNN